MLDEELKLNAKTELLLNFAGRLEHVEKTIKPALQNGFLVISDRFFDSTFAYQGSALGVEPKAIQAIKKLAIDDFAPDLTFLIDLPVEAAFSRIEGRFDNNRYEKLGIEFHQKVRIGFLELAKQNSRIKVIDGLQNQEQIAKQIISTIS